MSLPTYLRNFSGYLHIYVMSRSGPLTMIEYLTPEKWWSTHVWQAETYRTTSDLEEALQHVRGLGLTPNLTPSDEQPADPRYDVSKPAKPAAWRMWK